MGEGLVCEKPDNLFIRPRATAEYLLAAGVYGVCNIFEVGFEVLEGRFGKHKSQEAMAPEKYETAHPHHPAPSGSSSRYISSGSGATLVFGSGDTVELNRDFACYLVVKRLAEQGIQV
jgi:hypothetical protein